MPRYLEFDDRRWHAPPAREWPWQTSQKGNLYTRLPSGRVITILTNQSTRVFGSVEYRWSMKLDDDTWVRSPRTFTSLDECKLAALREGGVSTKEPVPPVEAEPHDESAPLPVRKIVVDDVG